MRVDYMHLLMVVFRKIFSQIPSISSAIIILTMRCVDGIMICTELYAVEGVPL